MANNDSSGDEESDGRIFQLEDPKIWNPGSFPASIGMTTDDYSRPFISTIVGDNGTSAILGKWFNLLQLSSYFESSAKLICVRKDCPEDNYHSFLAKAQSNSRWGMNYDSLKSCDDFGFGVNRMPMQAGFDYDKEIIHRSSTYVKEGSLFQVLGFFNAAQESQLVQCILGPKIQLGSRSLTDEWNWGKHYVVKRKEHGSKGITVSCSLSGCYLDVELFCNGKPKDLYTDKGSNPSSGDIQGKYEDSIRPKTWLIYVARFTIRQGVERDLTKPEPDIIARALEPQRSEIESWNPWRAWAKESWLENEELDTIAHSVEQVLSSAALPIHLENGRVGYFLINNLVEGKPIYDPQGYEALLLHIRLLAKALRVLEKKQNNQLANVDEYCGQMRKVVIGTIEVLSRQTNLDEQGEALRYLAFEYASKCDCMKETYWKKTNYAGQQVSDDPLACQLYLWFRSRGHKEEEGHLKAIQRTLESEKLPKDDFLEKSIMQSGYQLAIFLAELCPGAEIIEECLAKIWKRVDERRQMQITEIDISRPWEYLCRNHFLPLDLALARGNNAPAGINEDIVKALSEARDCYKFFRQPDSAFLKSLGSKSLLQHLDPNDLSSLRYWDFDGSSLVGATFLSLLESNYEESPSPPTVRLTNRHTDNFDDVDNSKCLDATGMRNHLDNKDQQYLQEIVEILKRLNPTGRRNIPLEDRQRLIGRLYFPQFMSENLNTPKEYAASRERQKQDLKFLNLVGKLDKEKIFPVIFPDTWNETVLSNCLEIAWSNFQKQTANMDGPICIFDQVTMFTYGFHPEELLESIPSLTFVDGNKRVDVDGGATYRIIGVERFSISLLGIFVNFIHPDALDMVSNYYGSASNFQRSQEGPPIRVVGNSYNISITLFHFTLEKEKRDGCIRKCKEFTPDPSSSNSFARPQHLLEVCTSVCITGDRLGEFWTCSIIGVENSQRLIDDNSYKFRDILGTFFYDKFSAKHLIYIVVLKEICSCISIRFGKVLDELENLMDLQSSRELYSDILQGEKPEATKAAARALLRVNWGIEHLGKFESSLSSCLRTIKEAKDDVDMNLSERRGFWKERLEKCEKKIWKEYQHGLAEIENCRTKLKDTYSETLSIRNDLISLCDWNFNQSQVKLTDAMRNDAKIAGKLTQIGTALAILTALFLPATFMSILLTTPMFKWPDPPEGQILVRLPFEIFWAVSGSVTFVLGCGILVWVFTFQARN